MDAYERLRRDGTQPPQIDGCADLEARAATRFEIESGHLLPGAEAKIEEGMALSAELGLVKR
jgi:hypothetical protein